MLYVSKPRDFVEKIVVVGVFCECDNKMLLLLRQDSKPQGNTWGVPAGKINTSETARSTSLRELKEETSIHISSKKLSYFKKLYLRYPEFDFIFHIFHTSFDKVPNVVTNKREHKDFIWVNPIDALTMKLIPGLDECIKLFYH